MGKGPGARELELRAMRERNLAERERVARADKPSVKELRAVDAPKPAAAPVRFAGDGPPCVHCDLPMLRNPQPKNKSFGRAWLCPVCDGDKLPAVTLVDKDTGKDEVVAPMGRCVLPRPDDSGYADATKRAADVEDSEVAKKEKKVKAKAKKSAKVKKVRATATASVKAAVSKNGVKMGRPVDAHSTESRAPWVKLGISRRTYYRHQLAK